MLEHQKLVLQNLANDEPVFKKELRKTLEWLNKDEIRQLEIWLKDTFGNTHDKIIRDTFQIYRASA